MKARFPVTRRAAAITLLAAGLCVPAHAQAPSIVPRTFRYAAAPGTDPDLQSLDLYLPPGPAPRGGWPLVVFIHGGGWRIGDKANAFHGRDKAPWFLAHGFAFASVNYRLSPAVMHPAHVEDVAAALAWLWRHTGEEGLDPDRFVVSGHSAGAHLAALVALDARRLGKHGLSPSRLRGVILLDGAGYDVARQAPAVIARGRWLGEMYADAFGRDGRLWADASPVNFVTRAAPPFLIIRTDRVDAVEQSALLEGRLRTSGVETRVVAVPGYSHADVNRRIGSSETEPVTAAIRTALERWMR